MPETKKFLKKTKEVISKGHKSQYEGALAAQLRGSNGL